MKKYLAAIIVLGIVVAGVFIRHAIAAPARDAARNLAAINGLTVGQTTEAELLGSYPTLRAEDLANAWSYVRAHRAEIDRQIAENEAA